VPQVLYRGRRITTSKSSKIQWYHKQNPFKPYHEHTSKLALLLTLPPCYEALLLRLTPLALSGVPARPSSTRSLMRILLVRLPPCAASSSPSASAYPPVVCNAYLSSSMCLRMVSSRLTDSSCARRASPSLASSSATRPRNKSLMTSSSETRVFRVVFVARSCSYECGASRWLMPLPLRRDAVGDGFLGGPGMLILPKDGEFEAAVNSAS